VLSWNQSLLSELFQVRQYIPNLECRQWTAPCETLRKVLAQSWVIRMFDVEAAKAHLQVRAPAHTKDALEYGIQQDSFAGDLIMQTQSTRRLDPAGFFIAALLLA